MHFSACRRLFRLASAVDPSQPAASVIPARPMPLLPALPALNRAARLPLRLAIRPYGHPDHPAIPITQQPASHHGKGEKEAKKKHHDINTKKDTSTLKKKHQHCRHLCYRFCDTFICGPYDFP